MESTVIPSSAMPMSTPMPSGTPFSPLGLIRTRYRGTNIDGAALEPSECLSVRGRNLNELIGSVDFASALWHLWLGHVPTDIQRSAIEGVLSDLAAELAVREVWRDGVQHVARTGAGMIQAASTGFLADLTALEALVMSREDLGQLGINADIMQGLIAIACAPYFLRTALCSDGIINAADTYVERLLKFMGAHAATAIAPQVIDGLLVAWHAGFGYITPTVLVPRTAIGTGVSILQAVAAGFLSSGPNHIGAGEGAFRWLRDVDDDEVLRSIDQALDQPGKLLSGFGHPLFIEDPRPPHLRALFSTWGFGGKYLARYDAACTQMLKRKGLRPNIDFITAAALLDLGVEEPRWAAGLGLCARVAAMVAHSVERRDRPPFGINSSTARKLLAAAPVGWL